MKKVIFHLYPLLIVGCVLALAHERYARAGQVRELQLSPDRPGVVHLAFGRSTAISFAVRPEKVVPGSPQAIEVNFLGKDLTIRPLSARPGNLLIYTKSARFVVLLEVGSEGRYDDVVKIAPSFSRTPLRLAEDSYRVMSFSLEIRPDGGKSSSRDVPVSLLSNQRTIEGVELREALAPYTRVSCTGCVLRAGDSGIRISCRNEIREIHCHAKGVALILRRADP